jgi:hypothetical protein
MRSVLLVTLVGLALACGGEEAPSVATKPAATLPEATVAEVVPEALRARLRDLVPAPAAMPTGCTVALPRLEAATPPLTAAGSQALADGLERAAAALEATPPADVDLAAAIRELAASLHDLADAFGELAAAIGRGDAAAARALGPRIDNGVGNAEASVAKVVQRCG